MTKLNWRELAEYLINYIETELDERIEVVYSAIKDESQSLLPWEGEDEEDGADSD